MTIQETIEAMDESFKRHEYDVETLHLALDQSLLKFIDGMGYPEVAEKWREINKKSGGFWYA